MHLLWMAEDISCNLFDWKREMKMSRYIKRFSSEDQRIVGETLNDPNCRQGVSLNELISTCRFMRGTGAIAHHLPSNLPTLIVEGQDDQVLSPRSSHHFYTNIRSQCKDLVLIPHCGHVLVTTEYIKPLVLTSIDEWLERHSPGQFSTTAILAGNP
jgi:alpha-beta hydrolase superfamily lysophospholipase